MERMLAFADSMSIIRGGVCRSYTYLFGTGTVGRDEGDFSLDCGL